MNAYDAAELAYHNGYVKGHEDGMHTQEHGMIARFEEVFGVHCECGEYYFLHHNYCPHCGRKLWEEDT